MLATIGAVGIKANDSHAAIRRITETDQLGVAAKVEFAYDTRGRLIGEVRTGEHPYHVAYEYDQGGNRTRKVRSLAGCERIETVYHYDFEEAQPTSFNNRLMYYETYETCRVFEDYGYDGSCGTGGDTSVSRTDYYYNMFGNPEWIVTRRENPAPGEPKYVSTQLGYARNGSAVTFAIGWTRLNEQASSEIAYGREFRHDGARQRYMNAELNPENLLGDPLSVVWSDYDGDEVYGDFEMIGGVATDVRSFELGMGKFAWSGGVPDTGSVQFYHGDQIGTTRLMTDSSGTGILPVAYTAFGERIDGTQHRYGYAGAWGYQAPSSDDPEDPYLDFPFLHVGARYYDAATGRFVQRDPIGVAGGLGLYVYARSRPTLQLDPYGLVAVKVPRVGPPWWVLALLCVQLVEREVVPLIDEWVEENYEEGMHDLNNPPPPPPPLPPPPPPSTPSDPVVPDCFTHVL